MSLVRAMDVETLLRVLTALEQSSIDVCLDGGWGVDALLGEQTRPHADLDLILDAADAAGLERALKALGFSRKPGGTETNFVLADAQGREVDVHGVECDARGYACFALPDGRRWPFPPAALAGRGSVAGREVRCLSVDAQVQCHGQGYAPDENDLRDMQLLQERFGVVLPIQLCRPQKAAGASGCGKR